jgi:DNA-binding CsgD family transcriptional regulator
MVGLATLSLMSMVAAREPFLILVDDAQWLDQASRQVIAFVARRLEADAIALFFATREPNVELSGIPEISLDGLSSDEARQLLYTVLPGAIAQQVREEILGVARGNPLAILEIPRGLSATELAGAVTFGGFSGEVHPAEKSFSQRIATLPVDTQILLLVTAAEPQGRPEVVWRAANLLGIDPSAVIAAEQAGLARIGSPGEGITFRHPLVRSAVYRAATSRQRREVHKALAEASDPEADADRRAWHRALAAVGPDEGVAAELQRSAEQAEGRGGLAATVALLGQAVALTPDPLRQCERSIRAAEAAIHAGHPDEARQFLASANNERLSEFNRAKKHQLEAQLDCILKPSSASVTSLIDAAARLLPLDVELARDTYLQALLTAIQSTSSEGVQGWTEIAKSLRDLLDREEELPVVDLLLDGLTTLMIDGIAAGAPLLQRGVHAYLSEDISAANVLGWWQLPWFAATELWDDASWTAIVEQTLRVARERGSLLVLAFALYFSGLAHLFAGELDLADAACQEAEAILASIGQPAIPFPTSPVITAWRGSKMPGTAEGVYGEMADYYSTMLVANASGQYQQGLQAARQGFHHDSLSKGMILPEIVETASRSDDLELANAALEQIRSHADACGTDLALGLLARSEALMAAGLDAESSHREAILRLERPYSAISGARAHLNYGEWLRRQNRRLDASHHLRVAHELLTDMGALAFADRAARELLALGERVRVTTQNRHVQLTPREDQIARLAAHRETNAEIAAQLFISPRTVDHHLRMVFQKLNINSRRQLKDALKSDH